MLIAPIVCYWSIFEVLINRPAHHGQLLNCERVGVTGRHGFLRLQNCNSRFGTQLYRAVRQPFTTKYISDIKAAIPNNVTLDHFIMHVI